MVRYINIIHKDESTQYNLVTPFTLAHSWGITGTTVSTNVSSHMFRSFSILLILHDAAIIRGVLGD